MLGLTSTPTLMPALIPLHKTQNTPPGTPVPVKFDPIMPAGVAPPVTAGQLSPTAGASQALDPKSVIVVGAGPGGPAVVVVYPPPPDSAERGRINAFPGFTGGVRVATADVNNDGYLDIIAAAGPGGGPHVKVFDGITGAEIRSFYAYDSSFAGGVWVAGGDINGDGYADIITGAGADGGPHVKVFDGRTGIEIASFYAYAPSFGGGVTVAAGDANNDGLADITGAGAGGAPHVKVIEATSLRLVNADGTISDSALLASFYAYTPAFTGGVFVSSGADFDHDGRMDIVLGSGPGGGPHVKVIAAGLMNQQAADGSISDSAMLLSAYAFDPSFSGGTRVSVADLDGNGEPEVVVGPGPGLGTQGRLLQPANILFPPFSNFNFDPSFTNGVYVG